jgi:predicted nucleic acid-binding protein
MVAVSDTSAVSNLALIGRLHLLQSQFQIVWIPEAVQAELEQVPTLEAKDLIDEAFRAGWLRCRQVGNPGVAAALANDLDKGEAEAITLATEIQAEVLLIDEKQGRSFARQAGIPVRGVLGVLIRAKAKGDVTSVRNELHALRNRAGFFVAPSLEAEVLRSAGE